VKQYFLICLYQSNESERASNRFDSFPQILFARMSQRDNLKKFVLMKSEVQNAGSAGLNSHLHTYLNFSNSERGGIELAVKVIPSLSNEVYARRLCTQDKLPHRKIGGRYLFTRFELESWMAEGAPIPASQWAKEFRQRDYVSGLEKQVA
jgi:hypothetical protein